MENRDNGGCGRLTLCDVLGLFAVGTADVASLIKKRKTSRISREPGNATMTTLMLRNPPYSDGDGASPPSLMKGRKQKRKLSYKTFKMYMSQAAASYGPNSTKQRATCVHYHCCTGGGLTKLYSFPRSMKTKGILRHPLCTEKAIIKRALSVSKAGQRSGDGDDNVLNIMSTINVRPTTARALAVVGEILSHLRVYTDGSQITRPAYTIHRQSKERVFTVIAPCYTSLCLFQVVHAIRCIDSNKAVIFSMQQQQQQQEGYHIIHDYGIYRYSDKMCAAYADVEIK